MKTLVIFISLALIASGAFFINVSARGTRFLGAERCGQCHKEEYKIWKEGKHSNAFNALPKGKRNDLTCLWCHATDVRENFNSFKHRGVQCEACHGVGYQASLGNIGKDFIAEHKKRLKKPTEETCRDCHSSDRTPSIEPFNYSEKLKLIKHWK